MLQENKKGKKVYNLKFEWKHNINKPTVKWNRKIFGYKITKIIIIILFHLYWGLNLEFQQLATLCVDILKWKMGEWNEIITSLML